MKEQNSGSVGNVFIVTSERQVRMLYDFVYIQLLSELTEQSHTATALAEKTSLQFDAVLYRLRALTSVGLIRIVEEQPRAGRPIKHYQAVAKRFFIADEIIRDMVFRGWREHQGAWSTLRSVLEQLVPHTASSATHVTGEVVVFAGAGTINRERSMQTATGVIDLPPPSENDRTLTYGVIELTPAGAAELVAALQQAFQNAVTKDSVAAGGAKPYSIVLGLAPDAS